MKWIELAELRARYLYECECAVIGWLHGDKPNPFKPSLTGFIKYVRHHQKKFPKNKSIR